MIQTLDLKKMGLAPMAEMEMQETAGGFWPVVFAISGLIAAAGTAWDAGAALGAGIAQGWNAAVHGQN